MAKFLVLVRRNSYKPTGKTGYFFGYFRKADQISGHNANSLFYYILFTPYSAIVRNERLMNVFVPTLIYFPYTKARCIPGTQNVRTPTPTPTLHLQQPSTSTSTSTSTQPAK